MSVIIPEKLMKQLQELVAGKFVTFYEIKEQRHNSFLSPIYTSYQQVQEMQDSSASVTKRIRLMEVKELFVKPYDKEQSRLELLYNLEKEVEELRKLKESVANIKSVIGKI